MPVKNNKKIKSPLAKLKGKVWLVTGFISYFAVAAYGSAGTIKDTSFTEGMMSVIDWLAASIIYFFLGAIIGHLIDLKTNKKTPKVPEWLILTLSMWALSIILLLAFGNKDLVSWKLMLIFPLAYGLFFHGMAFTMLFAQELHSSMAAKTIFDLIYLSFFILWFKMPEKKKFLKKAMLWAVFFVLLFGMFGCVASLAV